MCNFEVEDIRHLFLRCIVARNLWDMFLNIYGLSWFMPRSMKDGLITWYSWKGQKSRRNMWQTIPRLLVVYCQHGHYRNLRYLKEPQIHP
ncbi:hypothetical protein MTR67_008683 [Solanum verrucosum]|uniref:Reverse transcriptase zinc-binding domain-containing protein n=1 Tax=Solanum verrucosum TaxID=315347 RepID=A0AAF0Q2H4_SOLVR|nr:hypothetical protein MTR67_008683 [Solanum verrucosum]